MYDSEDYIEVCGSLFTKEEYKKLMDSGKPKIPEKFKVHSWGDKDKYGNYVDSPFPTEEELMNKINEILDYLEANNDRKRFRNSRIKKKS